MSHVSAKSILLNPGFSDVISRDRWELCKFLHFSLSSNKEYYDGLPIILTHYKQNILVLVPSWPKYPSKSNSDMEEEINNNKLIINYSGRICHQKALKFVKHILG
jgi:hypothetical protein